MNETWYQVFVVCHPISDGGDATLKSVQSLTKGTVHTTGLTVYQPAATN